MKKLLFLLLICLVIVSCKKEVVIKKINSSRYTAKIELGDYIKDTLVSKNITEYYPDGVVKVRYYYDGYNKTPDTIQHERKGEKKPKKVIEGNKTKFFIGDSLTRAKVKKGDTLFHYDSRWGFDEPSFYEVFNDKEQLTGMGSYWDWDTHHTLINPKYDKHGNVIYCVLKEEGRWYHNNSKYFKYYIIENKNEYY